MSTLAELALEEFHTRNINFIPLYPAVLVRVLPKEKISASGLIHLPDEKVNKPIYEGIVLRTYPPRHVKVDNKVFKIESGVTPGDHIIFPHWSGEPVPMLRDSDNPLNFEEYRLIPEKGLLGNTGNKEAGEILGILTTEKESVQDKLSGMLKHFGVKFAQETSQEGQNIVCKEFADRVKFEFDIFVKVRESKTQSGA